MPNAGIIWFFIALFAWKIYQFRKPILHNMKLYGNYFGSVMEQKVNEKKNETRKNRK